MFAVLVGVVVVLVAAVAFGIAVFGRAPEPQPATARAGSTGSPVGAPSGAQRTNQPDVTVPTSVRVRSGLVLVLASVAIAGFIGAVGSVFVIALGLLIG